MNKQRLRSEEIYDAILDDDLFARLPGRLAEAYQSRSTLMGWHYTDGGAEVLSHSGYFTDEQLSTYATTFAPMDPWANAAAAQHVHNVAIDLEQLVPQSEFERTPFYNEYIRKIGDDTARCLGISIANDYGFGMIAIQRGRSQQAFSPDLVHSLEKHARDLRRMLSIRGKLAAARQQAGSLQRLLDQLSQITMLVGADGKLLYVNAPGERLLASGDVLHLSGGKLCVPRGLQSRLAESIAVACSPNFPTAKSFMLENAKGHRWIANAAPFVMHNGRRCALLMVHQLGGTDAGIIRRLQELFALSGAEAAVAAKLAEGYSLSEIAAARGASVGTVRTQLKAIASKLGGHRQAEIVGVVKSSAARI